MPDHGPYPDPSTAREYALQKLWENKEAELPLIQYYARYNEYRLQWEQSR